MEAGRFYGHNEEEERVLFILDNRIFSGRSLVGDKLRVHFEFSAMAAMVMVMVAMVVATVMAATQ